MISGSKELNVSFVLIVQEIISPDKYRSHLHKNFTLLNFTISCCDEFRFRLRFFGFFFFFLGGGGLQSGYTRFFSQ